MTPAPTTTLPLPLSLPWQQPSRQQPPLPPPKYLRSAHTARPTRMPSDTQHGRSCAQRLRITPSARAPHNARICRSCCTRCRRCTRAGTAQRISGSACAATRRTSVTARRSALGPARRTMRSTRCLESPRKIARASMSVGRVTRSMGVDRSRCLRCRNTLEIDKTPSMEIPIRGVKAFEILHRRARMKP